MKSLHIEIQIYGHFIRFVSNARYIDFGEVIYMPEMAPPPTATSVSLLLILL